MFRRASEFSGGCALSTKSPYMTTAQLAKIAKIHFSNEHAYQNASTMYFHAFDIHMSVHQEYNSKLQLTRRSVSWFIYFYRRSTCFRRFLRPSSRAHNCTYSFRYCQPILLLAVAWMRSHSP